MTCLFPALSAGCSAKTDADAVPDSWLEPVQARRWEPLTVGDALEWGLEREEALNRCNANLKAIKTAIGR